MIDRLFKEHAQNLNYFFEHIDHKRAHELLDVIAACSGTLIFTGVGKSGIIAEKLAKTLISTGTKALYLPASSALHGDIGILSAEDLCILISKSGETQELIDLLPYIRKRNAKIMTWVSSGNSRLSKEADYSITLPIRQELCPFDLAPTTSTAVQLIFGDVLSVALMEKKQFSIDEYALNHPAGNIGKKVTLRVKDLMISGEEIPICRSGTPLKEALIELTKKRCGCILITDEKERLRGIFTDGDLRRAFQKKSSSILTEKMEVLMNPIYLSIEQEKLAYEALSVMHQKVTVLPVLHKEQLIGLIRMHDIVEQGIR